MAAGDKAGTLEFAPQADGIRRVFSYRGLERYPVFVSVGVSRDDVLAEWRARSLAVSALSLLLLGLLAWLLFRLWRALAREAQATEELKESESNSRQMLDTMLEGCQIIDFDWRYRYINDAAQNHNRRPKEELLGKTMMECWPGITATEIFALEKSCMEQRTTHCLENEFTFSDGSNGWFSLIIQPVPEGIAIYSEDITERRQAEKALRLLNEKMDATLQAIPDLLFELDENGCYHEVWAYDPKQLAVERERLLGHTVGEMLPAEAAEVVLDALREAAKTGTSRGHIIRLRLPHGEFWFELSTARKASQPGEPLRFVMLSRDITERKRVEEAQAWLAAIVENSNDAIIGRSLDGKILSWNAAAERLYGYSAGEAIGRPITLIMPPGHHADAERHSAVLQGGGDIPRAETVRQTKDGRLITVLRGISPIKSDAGEVIGAAITARDVSEHKRSETQLRLAASVFDNAGEGILITDKDNNILSVNRAFTEITGYSPEEAIGRDPRMLSSGRQSSAFYDALWASIRQTGRWQGELWDRRKDGQYYCELLSIAAIRDDKGEIAQHCTIFSDITKLKMAEAELMALNAQLEHRVTERTAALDHANKELEAFSYSVSHDLRAPLRHISGFSAIVLEANEGKLDAASVDYLKRISAASERMGLLIADLLELSRISRQELNKRDLDLSEFARQVVDVLVKAHPEREVKVTVKPDMSTSGDPGLMRIVLENLIGNAWKFTSRANEPGIEVGFEQRGGETVYYVRDNGAGFDMNYAKKLFEPFQRLHTNREFQGTGIGLSIVGRIVARHGGRIWAEARVGEGAAFYFTLGKSG
jgi:PAS domain S-box-containing protein